VLTISNKYFILLFSILFCNQGIGYSQTQDNLHKYWYYRDRLKYFVIPGPKIGESSIITDRNKLSEVEDFRNIDFGQHSVYTGYYLGVLATEYALLMINGRDHEAQCDFNEATLALDQFVNYSSFALI